MHVDMYGDDAFLCTCGNHTAAHTLDAFLLPGHVWTRMKAAAYALAHIAHSSDMSPVSSLLPDTHDAAHKAFTASPELLSAASASSDADVYSLLMTATPLMADGVLLVLDASLVCGVAASLPSIHPAKQDDFEVAAHPSGYTHYAHAPQHARAVIRTLRGNDTFAIRAVTFIPMLSARHIDGAHKDARVMLTGIASHVLQKQALPAPLAACGQRANALVAFYAPDGLRYVHGSIRAWQAAYPVLLHEITCDDAHVWMHPADFLVGVTQQLHAVRDVATMGILHDAQRMYEVSDAEYARRYYDVPALREATRHASADGVKASLLTPFSHTMLPHMIIAFNVFVDVNGAVYTRDGSGAVSSHLRTESCYPPPLTVTAAEGAPRAGEVFVMSHQWSANIWHWMGENLSRAYAVADFLRRNPQILIFVTTYEPPWRANPPYDAAAYARHGADPHLSLLTLLGIDPGRLIKTAVHADVIYIPEGVPCSRPLPYGLWAARDVLRQHLNIPLEMTQPLLNASTMLNLRQVSRSVLQEGEPVLLPLHVAEEPQNVLPPALSPLRSAQLRDFLSQRSRIRVLAFVRSASEGRRMRNMAQLLASLKQDGYDVTILDDAHMPPAVEILRMTASFHVLVGAHGAGFTNEIIAGADTCIVEVLPDGQCGLHYVHVAGVLGHAHHSFVVPGGKLIDMACDVPRVVEAVLSCAAAQRARRAALPIVLSKDVRGA